MKLFDVLNAQQFDYKIIFIENNACSYQFLKLLFKVFKIEEDMHCFDLEIVDFDQLKLALQTNFLGQSIIYQLKNLDSVQSVKKEKILKFLSEFDYVHRIIIWSKEYIKIADTNCLEINLKETIDRSTYENLYKLLFAEELNPKFPDLLYSKIKNINFDLALHFMNYQLLLGKRVDQFFQACADKITDFDESLFMLSTYFFGLNSKSFFPLWNKFLNEYPAEFWIVYWSEQIWQALSFINNLKVHDYDKAKSMVIRLPFSFLKNDYKKFHEAELVRAYEFLYDLDNKMKNGLSEENLDLWIFKFFNREFTR